MTPHQAYRRQVQSGWTRIEMLLAIYDGAIAAVDDGIDVLNRNDLSQYPQRQLRASQLCLLLLSGVDPESSESAAHIRDLCLYCLDQIGQSNVESWTSARNVLSTLREGFLGIREQGNRMEAEGTISPLSTSTSHTLLHV